MTHGVAQAPDLTLSIPPEALEAIALRAAEIMLNREGNTASPWMTRKQAAEYLQVPVSRLEKDKTMPAHRWDGRVLYHRDELDGHLLALEAA